MKTTSIIALLCAVLFVPVLAPAETLDDANQDFAGGHYHASTLGYQAVLAQNGYSAPVLFDLGNSYFREGDFAHAILSYQRAQWLAPNDPDIAANLALAQKQAGLTVPARHWSDDLTGVMSANDWAWFGSAALMLLCAAVLARELAPRKSPLFKLLGGVSVVVLFAAVSALVLSSSKIHQAVVLDQNASALISPFSGAGEAFSLPPGETVTLGKAYHDFYLVKDAAGHSGWIAKTQLAQTIL
jgi:tetratricopeptide (TPR) repeat protein